MASRIGISLGWNCHSATYGVNSGMRARKNGGYNTCPFDKMISNFRCLVLAENTFALDAACSILKDLRKTEFGIIDPTVLPYSNFGAITGSGYNYDTQVNNQTDKSLIWDVSVSKISFSDSRIKLTNPQVCSAIVDFEVYSFRNPRS